MKRINELRLAVETRASEMNALISELRQYKIKGEPIPNDIGYSMTPTWNDLKQSIDDLDLEVDSVCRYLPMFRPRE